MGRRGYFSGRKALQGIMQNSTLYTGYVYHKRHQPFEHDFRYKVYSFFIDLDDLTTQKRWRFLSYNAFNLFSISDKKNGQRDGTPIKTWIKNCAQERGLDLSDGKIFMLTFPRILGWSFSPLTLYFCYDNSRNLCAILYQVKNTFGQQHCYFIPVRETDLKAGGWIEQSCDKVFYVSPFIQMDCLYRFRLQQPSHTLNIAIHQFQPDGKILTATWDGQAAPLKDTTMLKAFFSIPLQIVKITFGIHWQALKLWIKGAKYIKRPPPLEKNIT